MDLGHDSSRCLIFDRFDAPPCLGVNFTGLNPIPCVRIVQPGLSSTIATFGASSRSPVRESAPGRLLKIAFRLLFHDQPGVGHAAAVISLAQFWIPGRLENPNGLGKVRNRLVGVAKLQVVVGALESGIVVRRRRLWFA